LEKLLEKPRGQRHFRSLERSISEVLERSTSVILEEGLQSEEMGIVLYPVYLHFRVSCNHSNKNQAHILR
jgi:hypothetical protein